MSQFVGGPNPLNPPPFIHSWSSYGPIPEICNVAGGGMSLSGVTAWGGANTAKYIPISLPFPYLVQRVYWVNGTAAGGNWDFGIYDSSGTKLYSTGSTAASGNSAPQYTTPGSPITLQPGDYYFGIVADNTTANRMLGNTMAADPYHKMSGVYEQTSAFPLPSTATFATSAAAGLILCGITNTTTGY